MPIQISGTLDDTNNAFQIGASYPASQGYNGCPDGIIDEVRVYDRALSADEIADCYEALAPRYWLVVEVCDDSYGNPVLSSLVWINGQLVGYTP